MCYNENMLTCRHCKKVKEDTEFAWSNEKKGTRSKRCKECQKILSKAHYYKNKKKYVNSRRKKRLNARLWFWEYKNKLKCAHCGEKHPACLEFHHLNPKNKKFRVSYGISNKPKPEIMEEIKKCIVLCSNCHKKLHYKYKQKSKRKRMITVKDILMGRDQKYKEELSKEILHNIRILVKKVNKLERVCSLKFQVTSGWRPLKINNSISGSAKGTSKHITGQAVDIADYNGLLRKWILENLELLKNVGLWCEDFRWTSTWVHFQTVPPKSGKRIYIPSSAPMTKEDAWSGEYDKIYDS